MPHNVEAVEVAWTTLSIFAAWSSAVVWRWARQDLAYVRASSRRHLSRAFLEDVRNARWRLLLALSLFGAGVVAMTQAPAPHRSPQGWIIVALLFAAPFQIVLRNASEATTRRQIILDLKRETRKESSP